MIERLTLGNYLGSKGLWKQLEKVKKAHDKLELKYDPDKKEISLNGMHRIPAVVYTKEQIFRMFPEDAAKQIFKNSVFNKDEHFQEE